MGPLKRLVRFLGLRGAFRAAWRGGWAAAFWTRGALLRPFYVRRAAPPADGELSSILVLRHDHIGDMIQTTPLLRALKEAYPRARLCVLASPSSAAVLDGNPHVDEVIIAGSAEGEAWRALSGRSFDLVVDPNTGERELAWPRLAAAVPARWRLGYDLRGGRARGYNLRVPAVSGLSAAEAVLELCRRGLNRPLPTRPPVLFLSAEERDKGRALLTAAGWDGSSPLVLLHPGGAFSKKLWPAERFGALAEALLREGAAAILAGGPADRALLAAATAGRSVPAVESSGLRVFFGQLSWARLLVCNNSGPLHAACALGLPTVSTFWGDQYSEIKDLWKPREAGHVVLEKPSLAGLGVDEVLSACREQLKAASRA